ncbi:MAG: VCBS repeat-containing protein, partial [Ignavibacteriales bacterium]|nr:VCBS repeat-containing protein [Ignavibacteriales bacterium]
MKKIFLLLVLTINIHCQNWLKVDSIFNPFGVSVKNFSCPAFADMDYDGDYDLFLGNYDDIVDYFINIGTSTNPKYLKDDSLLFPIYKDGVMGTNSQYPTTTDIDRDGDQDLIIGGYNGLLYYENIGDSTNAIFQQDTNVFLIVNQFVGDDTKPTFADLDADGDYDLLVGIGVAILGYPEPGITLGFRNIGDKYNPNFVKDSTLVVGIPDVGLNSYPKLADLDNDDDFDLTVGRDGASIYYYRNVGDSSNPNWSSSPSLFSGLPQTTYWNNPDFCDLDGDGDLDLFFGTSGGKVLYAKNIGSINSPSFQINTEYFSVIKLNGNASTVSLADWDNDGDYDLLSGIWTSNFIYFRNIGNNTSPKFQQATTTFTSLNPGSSYTSPVFVNLDNDSDWDIVSGLLNGTLVYYLNNGTSFSQNTTMFAGIDVGYFSIPTFADIDADGDLDLLIGAETSSDVKFYKNNNNSFIINDSLIQGITFPNYCRPTFSDIDNDYDYDLVIGKSDGTLVYYENIGNSNQPIWQLNETIFVEIEVDQNAHPGFADMDNDGRKDMIIGEYNGNFTYYKNL